MNKWIQIVAVLILAFGLAACSDKTEDKKNETDRENNATSQEIEIADEEVLDNDEVVVNINGTDILGEKYNNIYPQVKARATQTGEEVDQEQLKERTIDSLVERELVMQRAKQEGIVVDDAEVESEFEKIKTANGEGLTTLLDQFHLTEAGFQEQLKFELTLEKYTKEISDGKVSDEEIETYYDQLKENNEDLPELEELKDSIKATIEQQKSLQEIQKVIEEMKEKATIERNV
ncbi:SurA N-terminal domain-containing protein [Virgibacillus sp. W0430]|uniref:SurA N-terminal domain-containing protein n=1 Tax=Virgibacillus sp. W0430 TaxID=3391580 RepID=UPI003F45653B